ncbi:MAG: FAD-dependent monooxygenase [Dongiaceae bacterium]
MTPPSEVLVVGAGPVGLTMAAELARFGIDVRIVDKAPQPTDKSKAVVVWSRTLELLDRMGCADAFVAAGMMAGAANLIASERHSIRIHFNLLDSPFPYALMLPQSETERLLTAHLASLGIRVERPVELMAMQQDAGGVDVILRHPGEGEERLRVAWLIGCDGAHSTVRKRIGQAFAGETFPTEWLMADLYLDGLPTPPGEPALFFHGDGVLALFPLGTDNFFRLAANLGPAVEEGKGADLTLAEIQAVITRRGPAGVTATASTWHATFRINERKVDSYRSGRVFLAGDSAHIHSPAGGQGMNTGMQDAVNLAWKLALVCRGEADDKVLLDSYDVERSAVGEQTLRVAGRMTTLALLRNPLLQMLRNRIAKTVLRLTPAQRALARQLAGLTVGYGVSPLNVPGRIKAKRRGTAIGPGGRFPIAQRPSVSEQKPRFHLVGQLGPSDLARLANRFPTLLHPEITPMPGMASKKSAGLWLLRPDGYVALAGGDVGAVESYLAVLAPSPAREYHLFDAALPQRVTEITSA